MTPTDWLTSFPTLAEIDSPGWRIALARAKTVELPAQTPVFHLGDRCRQFILVLAGSVRVQKLSESGREILLYRVEEGQSCILTTACLLGDIPYQAEALTETAVRAVVIPADAFYDALDDSAELRRFVFDNYAQRLSELLQLIDAISFGRVDRRLAALLSQHAQQSATLLLTHQELARELGTAREVISRTLKEFERLGYLSLSRGRIEILDAAQLQNLADR